MQIIIESKLYDTQTAKEIEECFDSCFGTHSDANRVIERLFKTKKGQWFMTCESWGEGSRYHLLDVDIDARLMDDDQALVWCEVRKIKPEIVQKHFKLEEG